MRPIRLAMIATLVGTSAQAQWAGEIRPFGSGVVLVGAQGFARPPITTPVAAGYAHTPLANLLVGMYGGSTFAEDERSHATHALATLAYAQRRGLRWQVYPFIAVGGASVRTEPGDAAWKPAMGAGFGFESILGGRHAGPVLGGRVGYITRGLNDDESVAYAALGLGFGGRRAAREGPGTIADRQRARAPAQARSGT